MVSRGHVRGGVVILDQPEIFTEGMEVEISMAEEASDSKGRSLYDRMSRFIGKAEGLPPDASINHDHYLYGAPKVR